MSFENFLARYKYEHANRYFYPQLSKMCFKNILLTFPLHFENIISEHFKRFTNNVKISNDAKLINCFFNVPARTLLITLRELFDNIMIMFPVRWIVV